MTSDVNAKGLGFLKVLGGADKEKGSFGRVHLQGTGCKVGFDSEESLLLSGHQDG